MSMKWDSFYLELAKQYAQKSKDPSTKVACLLVDSKHRLVSAGYNGFAQRCKDKPERYHNRDIKVRGILHAEMNAVTFAQCNLDDHTAYLFPFQSCATCASLLIQAGIARVVAPPTPPELAERWKDDIALAQEMFAEAGVTLNFLPMSPMIPDKDRSDNFGHE